MQVSFISAHIVGLSSADNTDILITRRRVILDRSKAHIYLDGSLLAYDDVGFFRVNGIVVGDNDMRRSSVRVYLSEIEHAFDVANVAAYYKTLITRYGLDVPPDPAVIAAISNMRDKEQF